MKVADDRAFSSDGLLGRHEKEADFILWILEISDGYVSFKFARGIPVFVSIFTLLLARAGSSEWSLDSSSDLKISASSRGREAWKTISSSVLTHISLAIQCLPQIKYENQKISYQGLERESIEVISDDAEGGQKMIAESSEQCSSNKLRKRMFKVRWHLEDAQRTRESARKCRNCTYSRSALKKMFCGMAAQDPFFR